MDSTMHSAGWVDAIGRRVARHRDRHGLSREACGQTLGLSGAVIGQVEAGDLRVSLDTLWRIAESAGVHASDLLARPGMSVLDPVPGGDSGPVDTDAWKSWRLLTDENVIVMIDGVVDDWPSDTGQRTVPRVVITMPDFRACYLAGLLENACEASTVLLSRQEDPPLFDDEAYAIAAALYRAVEASGHDCTRHEACYGTHVLTLPTGTLRTPPGRVPITVAHRPGGPAAG
jgi:transcriptional regulator with XRE-family HTH domain